MPAPAAPTAPVRGRFHRKVAVATAQVMTVAMGLLVLTIHLIGRELMLNGIRLRAEAVASTAAAAMPLGSQLAGPFDGDAWVRRVRDSTADAVEVTLRDAGKLVAGHAAVTAPEAGVVTATARLDPGAAVPGGTLEVSLDRTRLAGLLGLATLASAVAGLVLVVASALAAGAVARRLASPLARVAAQAGRMAGGDLREQERPEATGEMATLAGHVAEMGAGLRRMVADLRAATEQVGTATLALGASSRAQVTAVVVQSTSLEETASRVAEMAVASRLATESAQLVIEVAERSEKLWQQGSGAVRDGMVGLSSLEARVVAIAGAVTELSERTVQIAGIIATVKDLAEQSNVLALNAAIEAAKVGTAGKGFAVVAEEMRRLAEQSRRATDEVRANLVELQRATRKVVTATGEGSVQARLATVGAEQASATISGLATAIEESSRVARGIADTTRRQTEEMDGIASAVEYLHRNMQETQDGAQRIEEAAQDLARVSEGLARAVSTYRI
jgi:methyl-accepting chemotaxis protein